MFLIVENAFLFGIIILILSFCSFFFVFLVNIGEVDIVYGNINQINVPFVRCFYS